MKLNLSKEWYEQAALREDGCEVGAGSPLREKIKEVANMEHIKIEIIIASNGFILKAEYRIDDSSRNKVEVYTTAETLFKRILRITGDSENDVKVYKPRTDFAISGVKSGEMRSMTEWEHQVRDEVIKEHFQPTETTPTPGDVTTTKEVSEEAQEEGKK